MSLFSALGSGAGAGLAGAAFAHVLAAAVMRLGGERWLAGPYGPPFMSISLYMGALLGTIGAGVSRRALPAALGLAGGFFGIAAPMAALTRLSRFEGLSVIGGGPELPVWVRIVTFVYVVAAWGTLLGLGAAVARRRRAWAAVGGAAGAFAGYLVLSFLLWAVPSYQRVVWNPTGLLPSPVALLDGLLTGMGFAAGLWIVLWRENDEKIGAA